MPCDRNKQAQQQPGQYTARSTSRQSDQRAFNQRLARQPSAPSAQSRPQRVFPLPRQRTGEQQAGPVGAGDREHRQHSTEQHPRGKPGLLDLPIAERPHSKLDLFPERRSNAELERSLKQRLHRRGSLLRCHSGLQTPDCRQQHRLSARALLCAIERQRDQHIRACQRRQFELRRQHANNRRHLPIQRQRLADHVRIAREPAVPQSIRNNGDPWRVRLIVAGGDVAAQQRLDSESRQKIGTDLSATQACRILSREIAIALT